MLLNCGVGEDSFFYWCINLFIHSFIPFNSKQTQWLYFTQWIIIYYFCYNLSTFLILMIKFSQIVQWDPLQAGSCVILIISIVFGVLLVVHEDALGSFCAPQAWSHPHQEKTLEHPLDCQEIQLLHPKGNHSWVFIGRTDAEVETPIFWPPDEKNWLIGKDPDSGKGWEQEEKMTTEDETVGWHHWLDGHEAE